MIDDLPVPAAAVGAAAICAVVIPCAIRKAVQPGRAARAVALPAGKQGRVAAAWHERLASLTPILPARDLYRGRRFEAGRAVAGKLRAPLYVISAGLGLVEAGRPIPAYGMTVAVPGPDAVALRVRGRFDAAAWWASANAGPYATPLALVLDARPGLILISLTQTYAKMIGPMLAALPDDAIGRLRLFGFGLDRILAARLREAIMPYDSRLDGLVSGVSADSAQRALSHFADTILSVAADPSMHREAVMVALTAGRAPVRSNRTRLSEDAIVARIESYLETDPEGGIRRSLFRLRNQDGLACEQKRFSRLYQETVARRRGRDPARAEAA